MKLELRGIGTWLVTMYLTELGGHEIEPGVVAGQGWRARVSAGAPVHIGSIRLGTTEVVFDGDPEIIKSILEQLKKKALRAGG